jgi:hypothetical protein
MLYDVIGTIIALNSPLCFLLERLLRQLLFYLSCGNKKRAQLVKLNLLAVVRWGSNPSFTCEDVISRNKYVSLGTIPDNCRRFIIKILYGAKGKFGDLAS